jgi:predicted Zn-dependent peptidase
MEYQQLGNKIHLILQPAERNEVNLEFTYSSGGSWFEQPGDRGRRHLLEHCLISSTEDMNFTQLKDYCFAQEISLNAYTDRLTMTIVAAGHKEDCGKILDLLLKFFFATSTVTS